MDELQGTILMKFEVDIDDLKEQAAPNWLAIQRLEQGGFSKSDDRTSPSNDHDGGMSDAEPAEWKPKFHKLEFPTFDGSENTLLWFMHVELFLKGKEHLKEARCGSHHAICLDTRPCGISPGGIGVSRRAWCIPMRRVHQALELAFWA